jgi:hypothetical protein
MYIYPESKNIVDGKEVYMVNGGAEDYILADPALGFAGEKVNGLVNAPLTHENAEVLRKLFPFTRPVRVLDSVRSFGVGDRLGIATPGHIRVFKRYDARPVFVQQSIRELDLTGRRYEDVLDSASFAVFRDGWKEGFGADGDHLKKPEDIEYALSLGFTMITLDLSEHIKSEGMADISGVRDIYIGKNFDIGEGQSVSFTEEELARCVHVYGEAVDFAVEMYDRFLKSGKYDADFEISIDETAAPTAPAQHFYVANELIRRGVRVVTIAPRFIGEFQKGIDYIGDIEQFTREMDVHAQIARHFGYKLSVHSGSDKFSVFPIIGEKTRQNYHVKTAGTNWLEAMRIVAEKAPELYRQVHAFALESFDAARKFYHVATDLAKIPDVDALADGELPALFENNDARQLIHITYGQILQNERFNKALYALWREEADAYAAALERHIGRHLQLLGCPER